MPKGARAKGGDLRVERGRVLIKCADHPAFGNRWIRRSHFVWWSKHRQKVPSGWVLHHKDENKQHDVISNLQLMKGGEHTKHHAAKGGAGRSPRSAEALIKLRRLAKERLRQGNNFGVWAWTEESRRKHRESHKGPHHSVETRLKMSRTRKGKKLSHWHVEAIRNGQLGRKASQVTKLAIASATRRNAFEEHMYDYFSNPNRKTMKLSEVANCSR